MPNSGTATVVTPHMCGTHNSQTYWVGGGNIYPIMRVNSIQYWRPNDFYCPYIITKNCTEGIAVEKKISFEKSKSNITLTIWIARIKYYM